MKAQLYIDGKLRSNRKYSLAFAVRNAFRLDRAGKKNVEVRLVEE